MSFSVADIPEVKFSLSAFVISLALAAGLISFSDSYLEKAKQQRQAAQKQLNDARTQLATAQSDKENMATYQAEFEALQSQKIIGNEPRLDWSERLEKLRKQGLVIDFKYNIAPQQSYAAPAGTDPGSFTLHLSPMSLQLDLLHEMQLLQFLTEMRAQLPGWFILDQCAVSAAPPQGGALKADCMGGWFTMKRGSAP